MASHPHDMAIWNKLNGLQKIFQIRTQMDNSAISCTNKIPEVIPHSLITSLGIKHYMKVYSPQNFCNFYSFEIYFTMLHSLSLFLQA